MLDPIRPNIFLFTIKDCICIPLKRLLLSLASAGGFRESSEPKPKPSTLMRALGAAIVFRLSLFSLL